MCLVLFVYQINNPVIKLKTEGINYYDIKQWSICPSSKQIIKHHTVTNSGSKLNIFSVANL